MDGTSPGNPAIEWGGSGMRWLNPQTGQWQAEMPPPQVTCAANPLSTFVQCVPNPLVTPEIRAAMLGGPLPKAAPVSLSISDADIERIARRAAKIVVELLRASPVKPDSGQTP